MKRVSIVILLLVVCLGASVVSCTQTQGNDVSEQLVFNNTEELVNHAKESTSGISFVDFKKLYDGEDYFILIDVRTQAEHDHGYIPSSVAIPRGVLEFRIASEKVWDNEGLYIPEKDEQIILYCKSGNRSALAAKSLQKLGYSNVKYLESGWTEWFETYPDLIEKIAIEDAGAGMVSGSDDGGGC